MWIYIFTFIISILFYFINTRKLGKIETLRLSKKNRLKIKVNRVQLATIWAAIPLILISGLRYSVGTDYWNTYYTSFYRILEGNDFDQIEIGYRILVQTIQLCTENVFVLFFITTVIFIGFTFSAFYELSPNIPLSIILLFLFRYYFISMNAVRQLMAVSIMIYSMKYVLNEQKRKYILCCIIGISLHSMALCLVPIYFFTKIKIGKKLFTTISLAVCILMGSLFMILSRILSNTKYGIHLQVYSASGFKLTLFTIALNLFLIVFAYSFYNKYQDDKKYRLFLNMQIIATLLSYTFATISLVERVYWMYSFPIIISLPFFLSLTKKKITRRVMCITVCLILAIFYIGYDISILNNHEVLPYESIIGKKAKHFSGWID